MAPSAWRSCVRTPRRSIGRILETILFILLLRLLNHLFLLSRCIVWSRRQQTISTPTDRLLQFGNQHGQLCNSLLQSSYSILAGLKSGLLKTRQSLEIHHPVLQETGLLRPTVDTVVRCFHWGRGGLETNKNILSTLQTLVESTCHLPANNRLGTFQMFLQVPGRTHDVGTFIEHFECNINMCNTFDPP